MSLLQNLVLLLCCLSLTCNLAWGVTFQKFSQTVAKARELCAFGKLLYIPTQV